MIIEITKKKALAGLAALTVGVLLTASSCSAESEQNDPTATANYDAQKLNDPIPTLTDSLERANIIEHLKRNNVPDRTRFIYLLADTGGIYAYFAIKGKVTSTGAQLTPTDDFARVYEGGDWHVVQGPTDDGSYGGDEGGIYFFTDTGIEIQWNGRWLLTDEPLKIQVPSLTLTQS
jgi:hypothetical protein